MQVREHQVSVMRLLTELVNICCKDMLTGLINICRKDMLSAIVIYVVDSAAKCT